MRAQIKTDRCPQGRKGDSDAPRQAVFLIANRLTARCRRRTIASPEIASREDGKFNLNQNNTMTDLTAIFELVDATDEETYHSLGMYLDLESAIEDASKGAHPPTDAYDDIVRLEVRERKIGFYGAHDSGICRAQIAWLSEYNESTDEYDWKPSTKIL